MPEKPIAEQFGSVIAEAMDEGWTEVDIVTEVKRAAAIESERRTQETARKLYGPAAKALDASPAAVAIVAAAKLPLGQYAITRPTEMAPVHKGAVVRAIDAALATGETCRLYRLADGWRFVGIVHADGRFTDERAA
jgi:hypothetical protein